MDKKMEDETEAAVLLRVYLSFRAKGLWNTSRSGESEMELEIEATILL